MCVLLGFVSLDVDSEGWKGGIYYSVGFFEKFIFGVGGILARVGIVFLEEGIEERSEVRH